MPFKEFIYSKGAWNRIARIYIPIAAFMYLGLWLTGTVLRWQNTDVFTTEIDFPENIPIIYDDHYNIEFFGLERLHPFDSVKYRNVFNSLTSRYPVIAENYIHGHKLTAKYLAKIHTPEYLDSLHSSAVLARITELGFLRFFPSVLAREAVLTPMLYQAGGSVIAGVAAMRYGWAINLGGGFHHASSAHGEGFCAIADISLIIKYLRERGLIRRAMIIDLDAHQGNGHEKDFGDDKDVFILDAYNQQIFPLDDGAKNGIDADIPLYAYVSDGEYFSKVEPEINKALKRFRPDIIIYVAGTDSLDGDPLGALKISREGVIRRDELIFKKAFKNKIPVVMLFGGGYQKSTAAVIADSIANLDRKFKLFTRDRPF